MLSCRQASRLMSERQERRLRLRERVGLLLHLWICAECRRFERQIERLRRLLRLGGRDGDCCRHQPLPPQARERIRRALQEHVENQGRGD